MILQSSCFKVPIALGRSKEVVVAHTGLLTTGSAVREKACRFENFKDSILEEGPPLGVTCLPKLGALMPQEQPLTITKTHARMSPDVSKNDLAEGQLYQVQQEHETTRSQM